MTELEDRVEKLEKEFRKLKKDVEAIQNRLPGTREIRSRRYVPKEELEKRKKRAREGLAARNAKLKIL